MASKYPDVSVLGDGFCLFGYQVFDDLRLLLFFLREIKPKIETVKVEAFEFLLLFFKIPLCDLCGLVCQDSVFFLLLFCQP